MAGSPGSKPAKTVAKSGSTQPRKSGDSPKVGGNGSTKVVGSPTPVVRKGGATNNGGPSRGSRSGNK